MQIAPGVTPFFVVYCLITLFTFPPTPKYFSSNSNTSVLSFSSITFKRTKDQFVSSFLSLPSFELPFYPIPFFAIPSKCPPCAVSIFLSINSTLVLNFSSITLSLAFSSFSLYFHLIHVSLPLFLPILLPVFLVPQYFAHLRNTFLYARIICETKFDMCTPNFIFNLFFYQK